MPPTLFTHTPRPAVCAAAPYDWQRYFGDRLGERDIDRINRVRVWRMADVIGAKVCVESDTGSFSVSVTLPPAGLRALARSLIDAAADIEACAVAALQEVAA